mmetsp:Transcript_66577/g.172259  ORF Transcript_66577/g.172259 Transcript_66577/m.172259 type:complete len:216 (+) Transcript_66577:2-649(+)
MIPICKYMNSGSQHQASVRKMMCSRSATPSPLGSTLTALLPATPHPAHTLSCRAWPARPRRTRPSRARRPPPAPCRATLGDGRGRAPARSALAVSGSRRRRRRRRRGQRCPDRSRGPPRCRRRPWTARHPTGTAHRSARAWPATWWRSAPAVPSGPPGLRASSPGRRGTGTRASALSRRRRRPRSTWPRTPWPRRRGTGRTAGRDTRRSAGPAPS